MNIKVFKQQIKAFKTLTLVGPITPKPVSSIKKFPQILVDGGTSFKAKHSLHFSVGDGDSFQKKLDLTLPREKDFSDLQFALTLIPKKIKTVHFLGFLGGRKDHELINYGEIAYFLKKRKNTQCHLWQNAKLKTLFLSQGVHEFDYTGIFSIVSFFPSSKVSIQGNCEYPLKKETTIKPFSSHGLSNLGFGKIKIKTTEPVMVMLN